jgi:hypothetical protein
MRLLNTSTITLEEFSSDSVPKYAILSHVWGPGEVSFQDMKNGMARNLAGYLKIQGCCWQAFRDGWQYAWIDTCCIDKSSSAELSEAINSMFRWYENATVCYAYLPDVIAIGVDWSYVTHGIPFTGTEFEGSIWFTRGWTLQELLAPSEVVFFDRNWNIMGTRDTMKERIRSTTGIPILEWKKACVAAKMSWASKRVTTRVEDLAYCLMGLFNVNMPTLYGEGHNAFIRLQLEILSKSDDESIFAWTADEGNWRDAVRGLLASSPAAFSASADIARGGFDVDRPPYLMTNKGLSLELFLIRSEETLNGAALFIAPLNCKRGEKHDPLAIYLRRVYRDRYARVSVSRLVPWVPSRWEDPRIENVRTRIYVKQPEISAGF